MGSPGEHKVKSIKCIAQQRGTRRIKLTSRRKRYKPVDGWIAPTQEFGGASNAHVIHLT